MKPFKLNLKKNLGIKYLNQNKRKIGFAFYSKKMENQVKEKNYNNAKDVLFNLTSNESSIQNWIKSRLENKESTLIIDEMKYNLSRLEMDITNLSIIHVAGTKV